SWMQETEQQVQAETEIMEVPTSSEIGTEAPEKEEPRRALDWIEAHWLRVVAATALVALLGGLVAAYAMTASDRNAKAHKLTAATAKLKDTSAKLVSTQGKLAETRAELVTAHRTIEGQTSTIASLNHQVAAAQAEASMNGQLASVCKDAAAKGDALRNDAV